MRLVIAATLIGAGLVSVAPAMAQGVYIGPGGVGVDTGIRHGYYRDRDHYRDRDYDHGRRFYEGRSSYDRGGDRYYRDRD